MHNFFVEPYQIQGEQIEILGSDVNHIRQVLRMKAGEEITIRDGYGQEYDCRITELLEEKVVTEILKKREISAELSSSIYLFQCLPKGDKMELIVQKAVELGAVKIIPVASKRCVVKLDSKREKHKVARWNLIAESAAKQSGRGIIPEVSSVQSFTEALTEAKKLDVCLIPYECAEELLTEENKTPMQQTRERLSKITRGQSIGILIGPEGGFEKAEVEAALQMGAAPVTLGKRILRTETAGLCILSVLMFELEE